jgi:hypothetical protein
VGDGRVVVVEIKPVKTLVIFLNTPSASALIDGASKRSTSLNVSGVVVRLRIANMGLAIAR